MRSRGLEETSIGTQRRVPLLLQLDSHTTPPFQVPSASLVARSLTMILTPLTRRAYRLHVPHPTFPSAPSPSPSRSASADLTPNPPRPRPRHTLSAFPLSPLSTTSQIQVRSRRLFRLCSSGVRAIPHSWRQTANSFACLFALGARRPLHHVS